MTVEERPGFISTPRGEVSTLLVRPDAAAAMLALGHGAGAGISHPFLADLARRLADRGIATLRYHFPYMEERLRSGRRRPPDPRSALTDTVRAAVARAAGIAPDLPLFAGGKSMGGRMTSIAQAEAGLPGLKGIVFFGFPLHPARRPSRERARHLGDVDLPLLFLQGSRDALAELPLLRPVCDELGARALLVEIEGADHAFHVLKRSGRSDEEVADELADATARWARSVAGG